MPRGAHAPSLRLRLALWLLLPLSLVVAVSGWLDWRSAAAVSDYVQDRDLLASAKVLAERLIWEGDDIHATVPPSALSLFRSESRDNVFLSVVAPDGRLLAGTPGFALPRPLRLQGVDQAQWYDTTVDGRAVRAVLTRRAMYGTEGGRDVSIMVGKTTRSRDHMLHALWWPAMGYQLLALGLAVLLAMLALTLELRPLLRLSAQLRAADPLRLEAALDQQGLHRELRPLAQAVDAIAAQLRAHSAAQRRFIADAAHQLRTPLALQATQIDYALYRRQHGGEWPTRRQDMDTLWQAMRQSNQRLVAVTNKLLLLAQAEHADAERQLAPLDLAAAALHCAEALAAQADRRGIDLGLDLPAAPGGVPVQAEPALLDALISNLLDNALRYTPAGGRVTVSVLVLPGGAAELRVLDNGPGIAPADLPHVFERFYRAAGDSEGSGLGLAIVREAAGRFGAQVDLAPAPEGSGLLARVRFAPLAPGAAIR